jgi:SAM-dependent methyltransferase
MCKPLCTLVYCLKVACLVVGADAFGVLSAFHYPNLAARHDRSTGVSKHRRTLMSLPSAEGGVSAGTDACASKRKQISLMVYQLSRIGADLDALGPAGDSVRVDELGARIDKLQKQLAVVKQHNIDMQMSKFKAAGLESSAREGKLRLHLGCGRNTLIGWLNADLHGWRLNDGEGWLVNRAKEIVLSINVGTTPLPLPDGSCEFVYSSHMLEHLMHPVQTQLFMDEVHRVLSPGGTVRVVVPDAAVWLRGYVEQDERFFSTVRREWTHWNWEALDSTSGSRLDYILPYLGASSLQGHLSGDHQFGFDEMALKALMVREKTSPLSVSVCLFPVCVCVCVCV